MNVTVSHVEGMKFEAQTEKSSFMIDCPTISPMEYFLAGLVACTTSDLVVVPKNQNKEVKNLKVSGDAVRNDSMPRKFNELHLDYSFECDVDDLTASRWVMASIETYCSTINTIRDSTKITYSLTYNGKKLKVKESIISGGGSNIDFGEIDSCCGN
ncbi:MAG: OsmC family protein [Sulfuricurvum sp.]